MSHEFSIHIYAATDEVTFSRTDMLLQVIEQLFFNTLDRVLGGKDLVRQPRLVH